MPPPVELLKSGNRLLVNSTEQRVIDTVAPLLTFKSSRFLYGAEKRERGVHVDITTYDCYSRDFRDRIGTSFGFHHKITTALQRAGYSVTLRDLNPHPHPEVFIPDWQQLYGPQSKVELRYGQDEFLVKLLSNPCGQFDCPPGFGKSFTIALIGMLLRRAVIHVVTDRVPVLRDRIYPELCRYLPNVGIYGGGKKQLGNRIQLFTVDSLGHSDGKADILIIDEVHEVCSDKACAMLARYDVTRNYGMSATLGKRLDQKDIRGEAICGPVIYRMPYAEALAHGLVTQLQVLWSDVIMDMDPCSVFTDSVDRKRAGVWRNDFRNECIAADANSYSADVQSLITCETVEHALALKRLLPHFELVYSDAKIKEQDKRYFERQGLWPPGHRDMTMERRLNMAEAFARNQLKKVIATTVWNVGVSFNHLKVLLRADAGGSPIMDTQIPGRLSRLSDTKPYGILHDYKDQFNHGFRQKAVRRADEYKLNGWLQRKNERGVTEGLFDGLSSTN